MDFNGIIERKSGNERRIVENRVKGDLKGDGRGTGGSVASDKSTKKHKRDRDKLK